MDGFLVQTPTAHALLRIAAERDRQIERLGPFGSFENDPKHVWLAVLHKKLADYAVALCQEEGEAFNHIPRRDADQELLELAAVCVALLEEY